MKCLDCKYSHGQPGALECRGRPPLGDERFPLVRDNQWCGTFEVAELNVVSPVPLSTRDGPVAGYQPVRSAGVEDIPPEDLTPPSGESAISGRQSPDPTDCPQTPPCSGVSDPAVAAEPQSLRKPICPPNRDTTEGKAPWRKGKHGQETSSQES